MRKGFFIAFTVTALLALVVGGVFSWTTTASTYGDTPAGTLSADLINMADTGNALYPTGTGIEVLTGDVRNLTPANPGISIWATSGSVGNFVTSDQTNCPGPSYIGNGGVTFDNQNYIAPGGNWGDHWHAFAYMATNAPNACQGVNVGYDVTINLST
jgi:hypothetical protein